MQLIIIKSEVSLITDHV